MKHQLYSLGELLIDFLPTSKNDHGIDEGSFKQVAGGAPANVAASVAKLGMPSSFIGKVGNDIFGHFLLKTVKAFGICTEHIHLSDTERTALAFVSLDEQGERTFTFYRSQCADSALVVSDIPTEAFTANDILHFGSISLIHSPAKEATEFAIQAAKEKGALLSYDPNLRPLLWPNEAVIRETVPKYFQFAHIIKIAEDEVTFLFGECNDTIIRSIFSSNTKLILVTFGKDGVVAYTPNHKVPLKGFNVETVDTTGAGDAFMAGVLYQLLAQEITLQTIDTFLAKEANLHDLLRFANANAALTTTKKGAFSALPSLTEVQNLLEL